MSINCGELDCKADAVWTDRCGCVFCQKHKWRHHGNPKKLMDITSKTAKFYSARTNDYLNGKEEGKRLGAREMLLELDKIDKRLLSSADFLKNKLKELEEKK